MEEIFESVSRSAGDLAGVFESDGETGYFYLYDTKAGENTRIVNAIRMFVGAPDFSEAEILIRWDIEEQNVGLFIRGNLWAAFDCDSGKKFGGNYRPRATPDISADLAKALRLEVVPQV
jgi:hypothetical protein